MELLLAAARQESNLPLIIGWGVMGLIVIGLIWVWLDTDGKG